MDILAPRFLMPPEAGTSRAHRLEWPSSAEALAGESDLVDDPTQADALARAWQGPVGDEPSPPGLLLIDPVGGPGTLMLQGLGQAVAQAVQRRRLLSPMGLRALATVDELTPAISAPGPTVVRCLHVRRLESMTASLALQSLLSASDMVAVLCGGLSPPEQARWTVGACALVRQHLAAAVEGPRWLLFTAAMPRPWPARLPPPHWLSRLRFVQQPHAAQSAVAGLLWNHILAAWMARARATGEHLALRPAG